MTDRDDRLTRESQSPASSDVDEMMRLIAGAPPGRALPHRIGRHIVISEIGTGGMGIVYAAFDPLLNRKVAVKLIKPGRESEKAAARLLREAQAMARLSHANVVTVHDTGPFEGAIYLVMDFVEGPTLQEWLDGPSPTWQEILALFIQAAQGLAAAHGAGIVHRDFKPTNVLITRDGVAKVTDFGIAWLELPDVPTGTIESEPLVEQTIAPPPPPALALTAPGALVGTRHYMAPEQRLGRQATAASDQFSFCVALYEALYGSCPAAEGTAEGACSTRESKLSLRRRGFPAGLSPILLRGLAHEASMRWPSMLDLASALHTFSRRHQHRRRWRISAGILALAASTTLGILAIEREQGVAACRTSGQSLQTHWNANVRESLRAAFIGTGRAHALEVYTRTIPWLDRWSSDWTQARTESCLNNKFEGSWTDSEYLRVIDCLDYGMDRFIALLERFRRPDDDSLNRATSLAADLPPISICTDPAAVALRPISDPLTRSSVRSLQSQLASAMTIGLSGDYRSAITEASRIRRDADALGWGALRAEVNLEIGRFARKLEDHALSESALRSALQTAAEAQDPRNVAAIAIELIHLAENRARYPEGLVWAKFAKAQLALLPGRHLTLESRYKTALGNLYTKTGELQKSLDLHMEVLVIDASLMGFDHPNVAVSLHNLATIYDHLGQHDKALIAIQRSIAIKERVFGPSHPSLAESLNSLAVIEEVRGNLGEAEAVHGRALAIRVTVFGEQHVKVAETLSNLANIYMFTGRLNQASISAERALTIQERVFGRLHPAVSASLHNLGTILHESGDLEGARSCFEQAIAIKETLLGAYHPRLADSLNNLAAIMVAMQRYDEAREAIDRALAIKERALGKEHPLYADSLEILGSILLAGGENERALATYGDALRISERSFGPDHPNVASALLGVGAALLANGRPDEALAPLERALAIRLAHKLSPRALALARFRLALALWESHEDRPRGREFVEQAMAECRALPGTFTECDLIAGWLADPAHDLLSPRTSQPAEHHND